MKETCIIYCRKSTDRKGRQENTHITQLAKCRQLAKHYSLIVFDEIVESVSAKVSGTRAGFNKLLEYGNSGRIDYIIIDEADRLSRDDIDSANFTTMLRSGSIKGLYVNGREINCEDDYAINMLWNQLGLAKLDNSIRSKKVKKNMATALIEGKWLSKAIFGYRNVGTKTKKDVKLIKEEATIVRESFMMRAKGKGLKDIGDYIGKKTGKKWNSERVSKMIKNTKYFGLQKFGGQEAYITTPGYAPIVSKALWEKANSISKVGRYHKGGKNELPRYFTGIVFDTEGNKLYPYEAKKNIYYHQGKHSSYKINISQKQIFLKFEEHIKNYNFPKAFIKLSKLTLKEYYKEKVNNQASELRETTKSINILEQRKESLINKYLDNELEKELYETQKEKIESEMENLEEQKKALKQGEGNILTVIENLCELVENLEGSYKNGSEEKKGKIIQALQCKLIINNKKELTIKESKLFEIMKSLNNNDWYSQGDSNPCFRRERPAS